MDNKKLLKEMTLEEKASLCVGKDYWNTNEIRRLNINSIKMSDGPHGLRVQKKGNDNLGINASEKAICFPSGSTLANTWDKRLAYKMGKSLGEEANSEGVNILLGPAVNIKRSPLCGRNFEYFSEDPVLSGKLGAAYVRGLQKMKVGACVKHYAVNNQENRRRTINAVVDERTLREIYLKAFEIIIKEAKPWAIMSAYNKVNGEYCSDNKKLLDILRKELKFNGIIITDWGAEDDRVAGILAGTNLEMPGGTMDNVLKIINAVEQGKIPDDHLNKIVNEIINISFKTNKEVKSYDKEKHHEIALKIAENAIVLLKNEEKVLPIKSKEILIIGDMAKYPRYQGAGSSTINSYKIENAYEALKSQNVRVEYEKGYNRIEKDEDDEILLNQAIEKASKSKEVVLFVGLTENYESEGVDRNNIDLPKNQTRLINEICKVNKKVIIVLSNGAPISMPWGNNVKAIVTGYLAGEAGGRAIANCLLGKINPCGKLAETYPIKIEDTPCYKNFPGTEVSVEYKEGIYVGYRYYDTAQKDVLFPFGYGLSYTRFEYKELKIKQEKNKVYIRFKIKNVGDMKGKEIAQIYISQENSKTYKPAKELKAFCKIEIKPNEEKEINVILNKKDFTYYNSETKKWEIEHGKYKILVGSSSRDIKLQTEIEIKSKDLEIEREYPEVYKSGDVQNITDEEFETILGFKIPERTLNLKNITEDSTIEQIRNTNIGAKLYNVGIEKMQKLLQEQNVNKATKIMMDMQKPLKKFYQKKNSQYKKDMVDELIKIAKENNSNTECEFLKIYLT